MNVSMTQPMTYRTEINNHTRNMKWKTNNVTLYTAKPKQKS